MVADGVDQVSLAEADAAVDEERVVGGAGTLGDLDRGRARELVGLAGDESVERESRIEPGVSRTLGLGADEAARLAACSATLDG